jgi:hypothetical protein
MSSAMPGMDESLALIAGALVRAESEGHVPRAVAALESIAESLKVIALKMAFNATASPTLPFPSPSVSPLRFGACVKCDRYGALNSEGWCSECFSSDPAAVRSV